MPVKLFSGIFTPGTSAQDAFELEVNNWTESHQDLVVLNMDSHITEQEGKLNVFLLLVYAFVPKSQRKALFG